MIKIPKQGFVIFKNLLIINTIASVVALCDGLFIMVGSQERVVFNKSCGDRVYISSNDSTIHAITC